MMPALVEGPRAIYTRSTIHHFRIDMKKFLVLYRMDMAEIKKYMETVSKEEQQKSMAEWAAWLQTHAAEFADQGAPVGKNKQVTLMGVADMSNDIAGYSIVLAESHDAATALLADSPHLKMPGATADVMGLVEMPQ